jgi:hypothetical protein
VTGDSTVLVLQKLTSPDEAQSAPTEFELVFAGYFKNFNQNPSPTRKDG